VIVPGRVLYDTGGEVGLISQRFADNNNIKYGSCGKRVATSLGVLEQWLEEWWIPSMRC